MKQVVRITDLDRAPFRFFDDFEKDLTKVFGWTKEAPLKETRSVYPACDLSDTDTHYLLSFDVPGIGKDDIDVEINDGRLTLTGERKREFQQGHYTEKVFGNFKRTVALPHDVDENEVEARLENGVLLLKIAKTVITTPKKIEIKEAGSIE